MRAAPESRVIAWLDAQLADTLYLSTISLAELLLGIAVLPDGKRKAQLGVSLAAGVAALFGHRVLSFDAASATAYAEVVSRARGAGRTIGVADGQIAAIAAVKDLIVATRDVGPFEAAGVPVVNPWQPMAN